MRYYRIRRCTGNPNAWLLVALNDKGEEMDSYGSYTTAYTIDGLLKHARGLLPTPEDSIQLVYYSPESQP